MLPSNPRFRTGLVIGKFYPPHLGHSYLIDVARAHVERLTIIVCDAAGQAIPGALRARWLREMHPDVEVLRIDDVYPPDDSEIWARQTVEWLGAAPDAVFTSEGYGERYARLMSSTHVMVDRARDRIPISASQVRAGPLACWDYLGPGVRAYYCKRVCVIGAESTGTTTLARALAEYYETAWVPEYGRAYTQVKYRDGWVQDWTTDEFIHIAAEQCRQEDEAARHANRLLLLDTDAFATAIWHERYLGRRDPAVDAIAASQRPDLYIVTGADIPFVQDGIRDGERIRSWMHGRFVEALRQDDRPFVVVTGSHEARMRAAVAAIEAYIPGFPWR